MSFDYSRVSFDPLKDYFGVVMQQGKVQLDADWNEMFSQIARRIQVETFDTFGDAVIPRTTPNGFNVELSDQVFTIGSGRAYVAGKQVECRVLAELQWDSKLHEFNSANGDASENGLLEYTAQPHYPLNFPGAPALPTSSTYLVYLDVWQRDITHLQDSDLIEKAVGVDSTGRMQTIWQVKVLENVNGITPQSTDEEIPGWLQNINPSAARLSTSTGDLPDEEDLCHLPPGADYKGDNHLYRVEIQSGGGFGDATFKWSRDNVTVASRVTQIQQLDRIVVDSVGRDDYLRFEQGDWVEITDDYLELHNLPGVLRRIDTDGGIDDTSKTIILSEPLPLGQFPVDAQGRPAADRNTRIKRWDQSGSVRDGSGAEVANLDAVDSTGEIVVPSPGEFIFLDNGVRVNFDLIDANGDVNSEADGEFKTGDHWVFYARSADASIEVLEQAPPLGIHHNYTKLAIVDNDSVFDLRELWPGDAEQGGCECSVCVSVEGHNDGSATIQQAINSLAANGGGTVCLGLGSYQIQAPITITNGTSVKIRGKGAQTILLASGSHSVIDIRESEGVALENLSAFSSAAETAVIGTVQCHNVKDFRSENCIFINISSDNFRGAGLAVTGYLLDANIEQCQFYAAEGISSLTISGSHLLTSNLFVENCLFYCQQRAINFDGVCMHTAKTLLNNNLIDGSQETGIVAMGASLPESSFIIENNLFQGVHRGIHAGLSNLRIQNNDLHGDKATSSGNLVGSNETAAILIEQGIDPAELEALCITGNHIKNFTGPGIVILDAIKQVFIDNNKLETIDGAGLIAKGSAAFNYLSVNNNHFTDISGILSSTVTDQALIKLQAVARGDITNNTLADSLRNATATELRVAIITMGSGDLRLANNRLFGLTPPNYTGIGAGIVAQGNTGELSISENSIQRKNAADDDVLISDWRALHISNSKPTETGNAGGISVFADSVLFQHQDDFLLMTPTALTTLALTESPQANVSVQNNTMNADASRQTLFAIEDQQHCLLSYNKIIADTIATPSITVVNLNAQSINVNNCYLLSIPGATTFNLDCQQFVVIGNTSTGEIQVNKEPLVSPWDALNNIITATSTNR